MTDCHDVMSSRGYLVSTDSSRSSTPAAGTGESGTTDGTGEPGTTDAREPSQPRWAWWGVGIAVPLVGILVTVLISQPSPSSPSTDKNSPATSAATDRTPSATPTAQDSHGTAPAKPVPVRFGPDDVIMEFLDDQSVSESFYPDFDSNPPFILDSETKSSDFYFSGSIAHEGINFQTPGNGIAPLPPDETAPSEEECRAHLAENAIRGVDGVGPLEQGDGFCAKTTAGRTVYIRVIDSPSRLGTLRLRVTVWELPG
jgi:hypothetical protein